MKSEGFTLIELMAVIIIMGIMAAIAIPSLTGNLPQQRLIGGRDQVISDLTITRQRSINEDACYGISVNPADRNQYRIFLDADRDGVFDTGETVASSLRLPMGVTFVGNLDVSFLPNGTLTTAVASNVGFINNKGQTASLTLMFSGMVFK
jgi:prepilin-type N-terminal cleavage/methylation domain-containing protein